VFWFAVGDDEGKPLLLLLCALDDAVREVNNAANSLRRMKSLNVNGMDGGDEEMKKYVYTW